LCPVYNNIKHIPSKRFAIFGIPGSGKSTFANKLGRKLNIAVHHLDKHYFVAKWKTRDRNEFLVAQQAMLDKETNKETIKKQFVDYFYHIL